MMSPSTWVLVVVAISSPPNGRQHAAIIRSIDFRFDEAGAAAPDGLIDAPAQLRFCGGAGRREPEAGGERWPADGAQRNARRLESPLLLLDLDEAQRRVAQNEDDDRQSVTSSGEQ